MVRYKEETDEYLMAKLIEGDKRAFDEIYHRYNRMLFAFFMKLLANDREKCEDFLQDLFMTLIQKAHYFDQNRTFKAWFYSVAHNMVKNEYKKMEVRRVMAKEEPNENIALSTQNPEELSEQELFSSSLDLALNALDKDKKMAFLLKYKEGFAVNEIADMQGVKEGTIKSRLFYVKKYLSQELAHFKPNV
jgi:RNA polymerase sigma-70 factor (ECF subfamily)